MGQSTHADDADEPEIGDSWDVSSYHERVSEDTRRFRCQLEHEDEQVSMLVKELPNGTRLSLRVAADLPGGFDTVHEEGHDETKMAMAKAGYYAAIHDASGTWPTGEA